MAEQGVGEHGVFQSGNIDRHPWPGRTADAAYGAGDKFFANSAFTSDQDRLAALCDCFAVLQYRPHLFAAGINPGKGLRIFQIAFQEAVFQDQVLFTHLLHGKSALNAGDQAVFFNGFDKIIKGAELHAANGCINLVESTEDNDRYLRKLFGYHWQQLLPG